MDKQEREKLKKDIDSFLLESEEEFAGKIGEELKRFLDSFRIILQKSDLRNANLELDKKNLRQEEKEILSNILIGIKELLHESTEDKTKSINRYNISYAEAISEL